LKARSNYWLLAACFLVLTHAQVHAKPAPSRNEIPQLIEEGRQALLSEKYTRASEVLESVIRSDSFPAVDEVIQYRAFLFAGLAAAAREDYLSAHEFMMAATQYTQASPEQWMLRARYAAIVEAWADAGASLTAVAQLWPAELQKEENQQLISRVAWQLSHVPASRSEFIALVDALFAANFTASYGLQPSDLWQQLILEALQKQDLARAREVLMRVDATEALLAMRIDKRFDALVQAEPKRFDLADAMKHRSSQLERIAVDHPRKLGPLITYGYALMDEGRYQEVLALTDAVLKKLAKGGAKTTPYDDVDESLNWIYNHKAAALRAQGRWNDALGVMEKARLKVEDGSPNVSQSINLGFHYTDAGQPAKALDVLKGIDWGRSMSPYGRMQLQHVRYRAYLQLGNQSEAASVLAYLREHHEEAEDTWLLAMLDSGDLDGAAALMIAQLRDPQTRATALHDAQQFVPLPLQPRMEEARTRWQNLVTRPDVVAAINEVGRREKVPIYDTPD
jgi:tetratricopeptide (TPR) repeat protein